MLGADITSHRCAFARQAKEPFSDETLAYIRSLDIGRDEHLLRSLCIPEASIATYRICCTLLKEGAARGLKLKELADMVLREPGLEYSDNYGPLCAGDGAAALEAITGLDGERPSTLERLVAMAKEKADAASSAVVLAKTEAFGDAELNAFRGLLHEYVSALLAERADSL